MATINPFQPPINYSTDVQSPFEAALGGFKLGSSVVEMQQIQQRRELERKALKDAQAAQTELKTLFSNPNATSADYARVTAFLPKDQAESVRKSFELMNVEQQQNRLSQSAQIFTALKSGNPDIAKNLLQEQATALRGSGREEEAKAAETYLQLIDLNPTGAQATIGLMLAQLPGGKDYLENVDKTLSTIRAEALAPEALREKKADADKKILDLETAVATAPDDILKAEAQRKLEEEKAKQEKIKTEIADATQAAAQAKIIADSDKARSDADKAVADADKAVADAEKAAAEAKDTPARLVAEKQLRDAQAKKAEVDADFARANAVLEIDKKAAELGLTKAQTNEVKVKTRKLSIETQKAVLELEAFKKSGGLDPAKAFEQEEKLRKEFQVRTKQYQELGTTFETINASAKAKNGPGDIALITGFMKMIDPGAIVRETDFALARDTAGLLQELKNQAGKLESGAIFTLDSKQRQQYVDLAQQYLNAGKKKADQDKKDLRVVVDNYKLNADNVFGAQGGGRGEVNQIIPSQDAIDFLKKDPSRAAEFDKKYGPGSSAQYLKAK